MLIPVDYAQANLRFRGQGLPTGAEVTIGLDMNAFTGSGPEAAASAVFDAWITAGMGDFYTTSIEVYEVLVKYGPNATGPSGVDSGAAPGTASGDSDSPNTATLVRKQTGAGGRTGRGRMYIPGTPGSAVDVDGIIDPLYMADLQTAANNFLTELATRNMVGVLLHAPGSPISAPLPLTGLVVDSRVATQRRRLRR